MAFELGREIMLGCLPLPAAALSPTSACPTDAISPTEEEISPTEVIEMPRLDAVLDCPDINELSRRRAPLTAPTAAEPLRRPSPTNCLGLRRPTASRPRGGASSV